MKSVLVTQQNNSRSVESFKQDIFPSFSKGTQYLYGTHFDMFDRFCTMAYGEGDEIVTLDDLANQIVYDSDSETVMITSVLDFMQKYISFRTDLGTATHGITQSLGLCKRFLSYKGIRLHQEDMKTLVVKKTVVTEGHSFIMEEIQDLIRGAKYPYLAFYLALISSGMRARECLQICKRDMTLIGSRFVIKLPAEYTKTKVAREVIISQEATNQIKAQYHKSQDNDLIYLGYLKSTVPKNRMQTTLQAFRIALNGSNLKDIHPRPTQHRLRAFFQKMAEKHVTSEWGHRMLGHCGFLPTYGNLTMEEKMDYYDKIEPFVTVFDTSKAKQEAGKQSHEIAQLKEQVAELLKEKRAETKSRIDELAKSN